MGNKVKSAPKSYFFLAGSFTFLLSLVFAFFVQDTFHRNHEKIAHDLETIKLTVGDEVGSYKYGLEGARGVIVIEKLRPSPEIFRQYAESRALFKNFEGSLGFGFIRYVNSKNLNRYTKNNKFTVHPKVPGNDHMIIELIEPLEKNRAALGLDIGFEANRKKAAFDSMDSGEARITKPVSLVQKGSAHIGFLFLLPVYKNGMPIDTIAQRRAAIEGWAYTPIVLDQLIGKVARKISSDIYLNIEPEGGTSSFSIGKPGTRRLFNTANTVLETNGARWKIELRGSIAPIYRNLVLLLIIYLVSVSLVWLGIHRIFNQLSQQKDIIQNKDQWIEAILRNAPHAVISTKLDGTITTFNPAAERLLGYSAKELIHTKTPKIFHVPTEVGDRAKKLMSEFGKEIPIGFESLVYRASLGIPDSQEWTYITKSGDKVPVRLSISGIRDLNNSLVGYFGIAENLTEAKALSLTIDNQKIKMVESAKFSMLGEMASGIAHEINNPLAIIVAKTDLLLNRRSTENNSQELFDSLLKIRSTAERIAKIVKGMRLFSRNSSNDPFEKVSASTIINSTLELCREKISSLNIKLTVKLEADITLEARPTEISQVIMNLIGNSIDAIAGQVEPWIDIRVFTENNRAFIWVTDSGLGIPEAVAEKIMTPFFTTKEVGKGTGLGLSISLGIVESHKGKFRYDSSCPNTRFVIELPLSKSNEIFRKSA